MLIRCEQIGVPQVTVSQFSIGILKSLVSFSYQSYQLSSISIAQMSISSPVFDIFSKNCNFWFRSAVSIRWPSSAFFLSDYQLTITCQSQFERQKTEKEPWFFVVSLSAFVSCLVVFVLWFFSIFTKNCSIFLGFLPKCFIFRETKRSHVALRIRSSMAFVSTNRLFFVLWAKWMAANSLSDSHHTFAHCFPPLWDLAGPRGCAPRALRWRRRLEFAHLKSRRDPSEPHRLTSCSSLILVCFFVNWQQFRRETAVLSAEIAVFCQLCSFSHL